MSQAMANPALDRWLGESTTNRWERLVPLLSLVLAGLLIYSAVQWIWASFPKPAENISLANSSGAKASVANTPVIPLANYHLLGLAPNGNDMPSAPDAPETQLKLTLIGTAAGRDPKTGVAIIADEGGKQREYQAGEIVGQATVDSIYRDRVVLLYQGRLETLKLPKLSDAKRLETASLSNSSGPAAIIPSADPSNGYVDPSALAAIGSPAAAEAVREQVMADPARFMGMLAPVMDSNGNLSGVKINGSGANDALLRSAGIQANDVIVSVNGQRIDSISRGQEIANSLSTADQAVLVVRREGREITLPAVRFR